MTALKRLAFAVSLAAIGPSVALAAAPFAQWNGVDGGGWKVDYQLHIPNSSAFGGGVPYDTDNSGSIAVGSYDRVAYVLQINGQFVFASFDAQSTDPTKLGVPTFPSGEIYQQNVG